MGSEWNIYLLEDVCEFTNGFAFKSTDYVAASEHTVEVFRMGYIERGGGFKEDSTPVFVPKDYGKSLEKFYLRNSDITIAMTDMKDRVAILGNTAWISDDYRFVLNQRVGRIRVQRLDLIDPRFLYYYTNWEPHVSYLRSMANSGVQVNLGTAAIKGAELLVPNLNAQQKISSVLGSLDDKIALNRQINTTLESMAQALFKSWFVDFDPVIDNALAAGNEIPDELAARAARREALHQQTNETTNKTTGATDAVSVEQARPDTGLSEQRLPPEIQQLFPDRFVFTEEMGWVPEGWGVKSVRDVCSKVQNGGTPKRDVSEYWENGDIPWLASGEVRQDIVIKTEQKISELGLINSSAKWLPALSTVVAMYGATAGEVSFIAEKLTTNQAVCGLIPKSGVEYYLYLAMSRITTELANQARGSAQQNISKGIIEQTKVIEPLSTVLAEFNRIVAPKFSKRIENLKQIDCLANLRDSLLPKLLSGQITIPDAEQQLAEVL